MEGFPDVPPDFRDPAWHGGELHVPYSVDLFGGIFALDQATGAVDDDETPIGWSIGDLAVNEERIVYRHCELNRGPGGAQILGWTFTPIVPPFGVFGAGCGGYAFVGDHIAWEDLERSPSRLRLELTSVDEHRRRLEYQEP